MRNFIRGKLSVKLFITIVISFFLAVFFAIVFGRYTVYRYALSNQDNIDAAIFNILVTLMFIVGIMTFVISFYLMIYKEIQYIKYISKKVKEISKGNIGYTIELKGKDEVAELCKSINIMSLELKEKFDRERENEKIKNDLISNVSHDLRNPLTSLIGYLEIIKNKQYKDEKTMEEYIKSSYNTSIKMKKLINELFEYTKLYDLDFKLNKQKINLSPIINQLAGEYIPIFEQNDLLLELKNEHEELNANIDVDRFIRVLDNLLSNALKYAYRGSAVLIQTKKMEEKIKITVENKGDNIPKEDLDRIFDKFYKIDKSRKNSLNGSGIGLSIAKKIVELHGGKIWVESVENKISFNVLIEKIK